MPADDFFRECERRHCLIARNDAAHYERLLTQRDLDALLYHYANRPRGERHPVKSSEHNALRQATLTTDLGTLDIPWPLRGA